MCRGPERWQRESALDDRHYANLIVWETSPQLMKIEVGAYYEQQINNIRRHARLNGGDDLIQELGLNTVNPTEAEVDNKNVAPPERQHWKAGHPTVRECLHLDTSVTSHRFQSMLESISPGRKILAGDFPREKAKSAETISRVGQGYQYE